MIAKGLSFRVGLSTLLLAAMNQLGWPNSRDLGSAENAEAESSLLLWRDGWVEYEIITLEKSPNGRHGSEICSVVAVLYVPRG